jgi:serine/threonine protein kinase
VRSLISSAPALPKKKNKDQELPLHTAIQTSSVSDEIILIILEANENIFLARSTEEGYTPPTGTLAYQFTPLTLAFQMPRSPTIISALIDAIVRTTFPEDNKNFWSKDEEIQNQLFHEICVAIEAQAPYQAILTLMDYCPDWTVRQVEDTYTIQLTCTYSENNDADAHDFEIIAKRLLHLALMFHSSLELVTALIRKERETRNEISAIPKKISCGKHYLLPFHYALLAKTSVEIVQALLDAYPAGFDKLARRVKSDPLLRTLQFAIGCQCSLDVIQALINFNPTCVEFSDENNPLSWKYAMQCHRSPQIVWTLLMAWFRQSYSEDIFATSVSEIENKIALEKKNIEEMEILQEELDDLEKDDETVKMTRKHLKKKLRKIKEGEPQTTLEELEERLTGIKESEKYLLANGLAEDFLHFLLQFPVLSPAFNFFWISFLESSSRLPVQDSIAVIRRILTKHSPKAVALVNLFDPKRRRPVVDFAHHEVALAMKEFTLFCGRYEKLSGPPVHISATAIVINFLDHGDLGDGHDEAGGETKREESHSPRRVVLKFMKERQQYERELSARDGLDEKHVVPLLPGPNEATFAAHLEVFAQKSETKDLSLSTFPYCLVMPWADRSLASIYTSERPNPNHVRFLMQEVGECVRHCQKKGIIHGDLKMLNVVRVNGSIRLIDFDAAAKIDTELFGAKFSSGILPPEMFAELDDEGREIYDTYWQEDREKKTDLWKKLSPKESDHNGNKMFVVKTFKQAEGKPDFPLPYQPLKATPSIDAWAYGVMLFTMLTREPWCKVNPDDDLFDGFDMKQAASYTEEAIKRKILTYFRNDLTASVAIDLVLSLLNPDPSLRLSNFDEILSHPFFLMSTSNSGDIHQLMLSIQKNMTENHSEMMSRMAESIRLLYEVNERTKRIEEKSIHIAQFSERTFLQIRRTEKVPSLHSFS